MNTWSLTDCKHLEQTVENAEINEVGFAKVRITKAGITSNDFDLFRGLSEDALPRILGRLAVGVVSETHENEQTLKKGDRVVISPYFPCKNCLACRTGNESECKKMSTAGIDVNGFLRDFVIVPTKNLYVLPEQVSDEAAVFIPYIAFALSVLDRIEYDKGSFLVIGSGGILGNLLAQLSLYYQAIPIMLDTRMANLELAKKVGVYYSFTSDEQSQKKIMQVTSGKLADAAIYIKKACMPVENAFQFLKSEGQLAIAEIAVKGNYDVNLPLKLILDNETKILPIKATGENFQTAINLIVNHSLETNELVSERINFAEVGEFFNKFTTTNDKPFFLAIVNV